MWQTALLDGPWRGPNGPCHGSVYIGILGFRHPFLEETEEWPAHLHHHPKHCT
jgi:hypothetical protein